MTWRGTRAAGPSLVNEVRFPTKDNQERKLVVKDRAGNVIVDSHGKPTRHP